MQHLFLKHMYPIYLNEYCANIAENEIEHGSWGFFSPNSTITNDHAKILQLSYCWNVLYFYITWNVNLGDELRWLNEGERQPLLFLKSLISLQEPGNLLITEGEFGEFDNETTAIFWDDKDENLLPGPFDDSVDVKSPTEEEHLFDMTKAEEVALLLWGKNPFGTHFTLGFVDVFESSSSFLRNSSVFMGHKPVEQINE